MNLSILQWKQFTSSLTYFCRWILIYVISMHLKQKCINSLMNLFHVNNMLKDNNLFVEKVHNKACTLMPTVWQLFLNVAEVH